MVGSVVGKRVEKSGTLSAHLRVPIKAELVLITHRQTQRK
jgi:hypothetical protein